MERTYSGGQVFVAFLAGLMGGLGPIVALLSEWQDVFRPAFVGLAMSVIGVVMAGLFVPSPLRRRVEAIVERRAEPKP